MTLSEFNGARWIWDYSRWSYHHIDCRVQFRRTFELDTVPRTAEILVTADSRYVLWVNGQYVNYGPARGFQESWPVDRLDIAPFLKAGKNVIAVLAYCFGVSNYVCASVGAAGFLLKGNAGNTPLDSGENWKCRIAPGYICGVDKCTSQYHFQEFFDCRKADESWLEACYDDSLWSSSGGKAPGCQPYQAFEERELPLLQGEIRYPEKELPRLYFEAAEGWQKIQNVGRIHQKERPYLTAGNGTERIFDFGKEFFGFIRFDLDCSCDGTIVDFLVAEGTENGIPLLSTQLEYLTPLPGGRLILKKGKNRHQLTLPWGGRIISLIQRSPADLKCRISVQETLYPLDIQGRFNSSLTLDNEIYAICLHTQKLCMNDAYIDGPWRENAQWWGDALVEAGNTFVLSTDARLLKRGSRQIARSQIRNGLTYGVTPGCGHGCILPDYCAFFLAGLDLYYQQTGSLELYHELADTAMGIAGYFEENSRTDGLLHADPRYWLFLDWCGELPKEHVPTLYNMIVLFGLRKFHELALAASDVPRAEKTASLCQRLQNALCSKTYDRNNHRWFESLSDELLPENSSPSAHTAAFAILLDLFPEEQKYWLNDTLLPLVKNPRQKHLMPSPYFMYYVFEALKKLKYKAEVLTCIRSWWGDYLTHDFAATGEHWPESLTPAHSRCHAWSAHPLIHYRDLLLGIRPAAPGWEKVIFDPLFTPGEKVSGTVPTPKGNISVFWDHTGNKEKPEYKITLPPGIVLVEKES